MSKKIIFLFCTFSYFNTTLNVEQLNNKEFSVYNKIMDQYEQQNKKITHPQIDHFLQTERLSIDQLYNILKRRNIILKDATNPFLLGIMPVSPVPGAALAAALPLLLSIGSVMIGTPLLLLGLAVKNYTSPSTVQKVATYSLMTLGGISLIPEIALELYSEGIVTRIILPNLYESITHAQAKKEEKFWKLNTEHLIVGQLMNDLKKLYPELESAN